jgi:hypothetical protein
VTPLKRRGEQEMKIAPVEPVVPFLQIVKVR